MPHHTTPHIDELEAWLHAQLTQISGKSALAGAIHYGLTCLCGPCLYAD